MYNKLLERQIKRYLKGGTDELDEKVKALLLSISQSYDHYEQNRMLIERSLELSSEELSLSNTKLSSAYNEIDTKNKNIIDSIQYAKRIQRAMLPKLNTISQTLDDFFIYYLPKDIVSGDFYWFSHQNEYVYMAAADCTGHGVPGALMSMVGNSLLNEIVNEKKVTETGDILLMLNNEIVKALNQKEEFESRDGMDIALIRLDQRNQKLSFSGANRLLFHVVGDSLDVVRGSKFPIGGYYEDQNKLFDTYEVEYKKGECIYFFSDGYADQFGGAHGKKFMLKQFKDFTLLIKNKSMNEQKSLFEKAFLDWMGDYEQVDDVLLIGIRL